MSQSLRLVRSDDVEPLVKIVGRQIPQSCPRPSIKRKSKRRSLIGSFREGKGWRKTIGQHIAADGRTLPTRFWLGMDEHSALVKVKSIEAIWHRLNAATWTAETLAEAEAVRRNPILTNAAEAHQTASQPAPKVQLIPSSAMTLGDAIVRYCDDLDSRDVSPSHKQSTRQRLKMVQQSQGSILLCRLDASTLAAIVAHWSSAKVSKTYAANVIRTLKTMLSWLDSIDLWEAPRKFDRLFSVGRQLATAPKVKTFPLEHLIKMYAAADERIRLWILLGLNCGFANMEVATLRRSEIDIQNGIIERKRTKTDVSGRWQLWPETIKALKPYCKGSADGILLTTAEGKPMVWYSSANKRVDALAQCWTRFIKRSKVAHLSFRYLRKTGATMIRAIDGIEVSEQYLAHSEKGIARFYSVPSQDRLDKALAELRTLLQPMFDNIG